jgi:hypothetical protein
MTFRLRTDDLEWQEIDSDIVVLDGREAVYLTLNGSGALLWRMLVTETTREDLVAALIDAYDVDEPTALADTDSFLRSLTDQGLLAA